LETLANRQSQVGEVSLCLGGGDLANDIYDYMATLGAKSPLDASNIHLWWNWDYFVPLDNPARNSLTALSRLGGAFTFDPTKIHPIPSVGVAADPEAGAQQYAGELRDGAPIDICLLELTSDGHIAGLFPPHDNSTSSLVAGIHQAPGSHQELITMTLAGLNTCREIWVLAHGKDLAREMKSAYNQDPSSITSELTGTEIVLYLTDIEATSLLPFHQCELSTGIHSAGQ